jgi:tRNA pseudouridine38-40 synthase
MRIALGIEYDGSAYSGWQLQDGVVTVQGVLEDALAKVANTPIRVITAGRTDTGVHATGQVVHLETDVERSDFSWVRGTTRYLPDDVTVLWAQHVDDEFHARFSAVERSYQYLILNRRERPAILHKKVTWEYRSLDISLMKTAASTLVGRHDFNAYRAVACQAKSPVRDLRELSIERHGDFVVWAQEVLLSCDRTRGGVTAPPDGLYLIQILYPEIFRIPTISNRSWMFGL